MRHPVIYVITDLEGVGGVNNHADFCKPGGYRHLEACRHLADEVNAVARACFDGGFASVILNDAHGSAGSIIMDCVDRRVYIQRGTPNGFKFYPESYDAIAFVGQHAKAGSKKAQLAHTQTPEAVDFRINGLSVGEYGQLAICAADAGIPVIFASGDLALTKEVAELTPNVPTVAVKEGLSDAPTDIRTNEKDVLPMQCSVIHYPRKKVMEEIYDKMKAATVAFLGDKNAFFQSFPLKAPYIAQAEYRAGESYFEPGTFLPARQITTPAFNTPAEALNYFYSKLEWISPNGLEVKELLIPGLD